MKGRPRTPTKLKLVKGTDRADRLNPHEPDPALSGIPEPPEHLTAEAAKEWKRMAPRLAEFGLLTDHDLGAFTGYCIAYGNVVDSTALVKKHGTLVKDRAGFPTKNPALLVQRENLDLMNTYLSHFGMSPSTRSRVSGVNQEKKQENKKDRFFS